MPRWEERMIKQTQGFRYVIRPRHTFTFYGVMPKNVAQLVATCKKGNAEELAVNGYVNAELFDPLAEAADSLTSITRLTLMYPLFGENIPHLARTLRQLPNVVKVTLRPHWATPPSEYVIGLVREIEGLPDSRLKSITLSTWSGKNEVLYPVSAEECRKIVQHFVFDASPPRITLWPDSQSAREIWSRVRR